MARLKEKYTKELAAKLQEKLGVKNKAADFFRRLRQKISVKIHKTAPQVWFRTSGGTIRFHRDTSLPGVRIESI